MPAQNMEIELFDALLHQLPHGKHTISLQGEGEPLIHPAIWEMIKKVKKLGHRPYLITNGSSPYTPELARHIPIIGISIDTIDTEEAKKIGRSRLHRVLENFEKLLVIAGPQRLIVHTVNFGQNLDALRNYLNLRGVTQHVVQPLQPKDDYRYRYPDRIFAKTVRESSHPCTYLLTSGMRYYNINGIPLPCPYIKNMAHYISEAKLTAEFSRGTVPAACSGCREIQGS